MNNNKDSCYDPLVDEHIFQILDEDHITTFTKLFDKLYKNKIIGNRITLSKHLNYLFKKNIILWDRGIEQTQEGYIKIKRQGSIKFDPDIEELRRMNLSIIVDYSDKSGICKKWREKHPIEFKDFNLDQKRRVFCQLLLSHIAQGSFIALKEGFSISELINQVTERKKISSIKEIKETFEQFKLKDFIYTQYYSQLTDPKNRFLHIRLSPREIKECIKLLEQEEIIRKGEYYQEENEGLYTINDIRSKEKMVKKIDKNDKEYIDYDEIYTSTFFLICERIFSDIFFRMRLFWMFKKSNKEHEDWFVQIYGAEMHKEFFLTLKKEQRQEYEDKIRNQLKKEKEKRMEKKIKEIAMNEIKRYDESIKKNLNGIKQKYGQKIKNLQNKAFYNLILEVIYPSFLRKEYNLYLDV